jgi:hypothetical protein
MAGTWPAMTQFFWAVGFADERAMNGAFRSASKRAR